jgi:hypothetical protein
VSPDFVRESIAQLILGDIKVIVGLKAEPELGGRAEVFCQAEGGVRRDRPFTKNDFVDPSRMHADAQG